jgi:hypothetical protein
MKTKLFVLFFALASFAFSDGVLLTWTDNSNNETGFIIERGLGSNATIPFVEVGRVLSNVVTYTDKTVAKNTTYSYRIRAFNEGGNSAPSNVATVRTTPNPPAAPSNNTAVVIPGN